MIVNIICYFSGVITVLIIYAAFSYVIINKEEMKKTEAARDVVLYIMNNTYEQFIRDLNSNKSSGQALGVKAFIKSIPVAKNIEEKSVYKKLKSYYIKEEQKCKAKLSTIQNNS